MLNHRMPDDRDLLAGAVGLAAARRGRRGRRILERGEAYEASGRTGDAPILRFLNKEYPLKAHVVKLGGFSGHGDQNEMLRFLKESNLNIKHIAVVHGEDEQSKAFVERLAAEGFKVTLPYQGQSIWIR